MKATTLLIGIVVGLGIALGVAVLFTGDPTSPRDPTAPAVTTTSSTVVDRGGDVLVFLEPDVTEQERTDLEGAIAEHAYVASYAFWDKAASEAEATRLFADNPEMLAKIEQDPDLIPASYRISLVSQDVRSAAMIITDFDGQPGVLQVVATDGLAPG